MRVALGIGLGLGAIGAALPATLLLWVVFALLATGVAAEALEQTGGLAPTTFGGGFWLAIVLNAAVVLLSLIRAIIGKRAPWEPLTWLIVIYGVLIWTLIPLDWSGIWDVPDVLTTFAVLGAKTLISYVLPVALLVLVTRGLMHAWRAGQLSVRTARRITALSACLGLASMTVLGALITAGAEGYFAELTPTPDDMKPLAATLAEGERRRLIELSNTIGPPAPARYASVTGHDAFGTCAEELGSRRSPERPVLERAREQLIRSGLSLQDAEDAVMDTLLRVCLQHASTGVKDIVPYFWKALQNYRKRGRKPSGGEYGDEPDDEWQDPRDRLALEEDLRALRAAFDLLDSHDRLLLELRYVNRLSHAAIAERLGKREAATRQAVKRAQDRLRRRFQQETGDL